MAEPSDVPESDTSVEPAASLSTHSSASNLASQHDGDTTEDQAQSIEEEPSASESTLKGSSANDTEEEEDEEEEDEEDGSEENPAIEAAVQELSNAEEPSLHSSPGTLTPAEDPPQAAAPEVPDPPQTDKEESVPSPPVEPQVVEDSPPVIAQAPIEPPPDGEQPVVVQASQQISRQRSAKLLTPDKVEEKECPKHHMLEQIFSMKYNKPICPACLKDGHDKHDWHPKSDYVNQIAGRAEDMAGIRQKMAEMISDSDQRMEQTSAQQISVKDFIDKQANRLHSLIDNERAALLKMTEDASSRQTSLLQQRKDIALEFDQFFVDASAHCDPDNAPEAVLFYKQLIESIEANLDDAKKCYDTPLPAEAQISAAMKDSPTEVVLQSAKAQFGQVVAMRQPAGPADISVTGSGAKRAIVGIQATFTISTIKNPDKLPCIFSSSISIALIARDNKKTTRIDCVCKKEAEDKVIVSYTASKPGVYSLQIKVGQECVFSRPTTVLVSPPIAYEKKVTAIKRLHGPSGVVVNANGLLAIAETTGNAITMKELGKSRKRFGKKGFNDGQLMNPVGVTYALGQAQVLVADTGNHRVQRFDYKGQLIASVGCIGEDELQFNTPVDIAMDSNKRVYVAEAGNGRIQVLSSDFFFQQFIRCPQGATPTGVSVDSENMLYISYQELYVQKLHPDGQYICNIGAVHLTNPSCLFISQFDVVYVGDRATNSIIIFSPSGEFLQQIDNRNESVQPSDFGSPGGIAVDAKNNLYVSDSDNGRILIFKQAKERSTRKQPTLETADNDAGLLSVHPHVYDNEGEVGGVSLPWRRVSLVLEVVQNKCGEMQDSQQLVPHLFSLLSWCLEVDDKLMSSFEYIQQLILTSLLNICTTWGLHNTRALPAANFNVELIVKCVRISTNPHTHQTALLLLSSAAAVFPTHILHNVMPIFTFMGASLLRRDDQYSLHVIKKTVDIIIPALVKSGSMKRSSTLLSTVTGIIRVFVDAVPHVPAHRRLPLFTHLLSTIDPHEYLYIALGLLVEKHVVLPTGKEQASDEAYLDEKYIVSLAREHSPLEQLWSCFKLIEYLRNLPEEKPENARKARQLPASVTLLFNIALHSQKQLRQFKYSLVSLINTILNGLSYSDIQRSQDMNEEDKKQLIMRIFCEALHYTTSLSQSQTHSSDEASNRFWQAMLKKTCDTIDGVTSLLTLDPFLSIVHQLLAETNGDVQKKSLNMLNTKLENVKNKHLDSRVHTTLLEVVDVVMGVALNESVGMTTRQNALYSLKLLIQCLASQHRDKFIKVTESLLDMLEQHSELVCSDGLLCIAELWYALVARVIPLLPRILACLMTHCGQVTDGKDQLHTSALSSLCVVVETLPQFLSSTLSDMIVKSCHCDLINNGCIELTQQASKLRLLLANRIPARVFLPAIVKCYNALWDNSKSSVLALVDMLSVSIERLTRDEVRTHSQTMVDTFLVLLDYRTMKQGVELASVLEIEKSVINAFTCLVVKLSEASFRPIFLKLLDWSSHSDSHHKRAITFYHLTNIIAEKLKSLFLLFAGHMVQNTAELLDACNDSKRDELFFADLTDHSDEERTEMTSLLLRFILETLHKCLLYDKGSFLTKSNFTTLLKPLVDQVSNHHGGAVNQLVPCVSQLAIAAGKETLWKRLNNELLLTTRHCKPEVKITVLKIVREIYTKLGEEFAVLLPETIPFLAELMEDESLDVEKQAHSVILLIEEIVGESIQQYF